MQKRQIAFILVIPFILLSICSMTSFLFPMHNRVDQNCFMTIGKGILYGQVPYRDLFDHKGPIIYFMHAAAAILSKDSFIGIFLIEYIFLVIFMIYMLKIARLFLSEKHSYLAVLFTSSLVLTTNCYLRGDNAEEYVIALMTVSIYYTLSQYTNQNDKTIPYWVFILNGLFIGFVLWLKFNLLGFWIGWALFIFVPMLIDKKYKSFLISSLLVISGITIITIPWIIYFSANNALYHLFYTYFYCNIFLYTKKLTIFARFYLLFESFVKSLVLNPFYTIVTFVGIYYFLLTDNYIINKQCRNNLLYSFLFLYLGVYFSGVWYDYYALIIAAYTIFGTIVTLTLLKRYVTSKNKNSSNLSTKPYEYYPTLTAFIVLLTVLNSNCLPYINKKRKEYPQYKFAQIIERDQNPTLLNYGFIDGGFYFASKIQPRNKYFHKVNIAKNYLPEMYEEQQNMIKQKLIDFVVVRVSLNRKGTDIICSELYENYKVVAFANDINDPYRYVLFKKT